MILPLQKFTTLVEGMSANVQGGAVQLVDFSVGSVLRALMESCAAVALWMQWLILQVLTVTRAATSIGSDLDSWMLDFGLVRLPGSSAAGSVTFARYTASLPTTVLVGTLVYTVDRTGSFAVVEDTTNAAWNGLAGYTLGVNVASITVPVLAVVAGAAGNILAGTIGLLGTAIPGVDTVANLSGFTGGVDPESDAALRARFQLYINSRALATGTAIEFAVSTVQQGLRYSVLENVSTAGQLQPGQFWVVVDDGTGDPPSTLITAVSLAVAAVRPIGSTYAVTGPGIVQAVVAMVVATSNPATQSAVFVAIQAAVAAWIQGLPIAGTLAISKLEAIAHMTDPSVISVTSCTINGVVADLTVSQSQVILAAQIEVD